VNDFTWVRNDPDIDAAYASEGPNYPDTRSWLNATWISGRASRIRVMMTIQHFRTLMISDWCC